MMRQINPPTPIQQREQIQRRPRIPFRNTPVARIRRLHHTLTQSQKSRIQIPKQWRTHILQPIMLQE